uniref:Uncharacterized protein n=1 Tax=Caenorhabditis japonica TaxID=281687 RepID=A0A8R1EBU4_CAEJA
MRTAESAEVTSRRCHRCLSIKRKNQNIGQSQKTVQSKKQPRSGMLSNFLQERTEIFHTIHLKQEPIYFLQILFSIFSLLAAICRRHCIVFSQFPCARR